MFISMCTAGGSAFGHVVVVGVPVVVRVGGLVFDNFEVVRVSSCYLVTA